MRRMMLLLPNPRQLVPRPPPFRGDVPAPLPVLPPARQRRGQSGGGPRCGLRCWKSTSNFRRRSFRPASGAMLDGRDQTCCACPVVVAGSLATAAPWPSAPAGSDSAPEGARTPSPVVPHGVRTSPVLCGAMAPSRAAPRGGRTLPAHGVAREDFSCPTKAAAASKRASLVPAAQSPPALQGWQGNGPFSSRSRPSK